ncbi:MAG: aminotransferase class III-fold pyridoxal phosphate-dependent enzyme [candidate division KSB1 bacterium]|nr:aminotransferase class III-fold pyridoxal phosphate-dependent enzyme [candidate division KSB1 bacterium]
MREDRDSMLNLEKSMKLFDRALEIIPGGTNTNAKRVYNLFDRNFFPAYIERGEGAYVWDLDGNKYIDYIAALAPILLGYNHPRVKRSILEQLAKGTLFSLPSSNEVELSELLIEKIPCAEMVKLMKTGADVTSAAVRAARLATGKEIILSCEYHGWHDWWAAKIGEKGVPACYRQLIYNFEFNNFPQLQQLADEHDGKIACIILTPAAYGVAPKDNFLQQVRQLAAAHGIVLIFDEIITGFRWALGGAQERYGVVPDLAAFGKSMANGMPIAALVGKKELMQPLQTNLVTTTYASEALSIAAAIETIHVIDEENIPARVQALADRLRTGLADIADSLPVEINTFDPNPAVKFEFMLSAADEKRQLNFAFMKYCTEQGLLIRPDGNGFSLCPIAALSEQDVSYTIEVFHAALKNSLSLR